MANDNQQRIAELESALKAQQEVGDECTKKILVLEDELSKARAENVALTAEVVELKTFQRRAAEEFEKLQAIKGPMATTFSLDKENKDGKKLLAALAAQHPRKCGVYSVVSATQKAAVLHNDVYGYVKVVLS